MALNKPIRHPAPSCVELHIEELVLHGFATNDGFHLGSAFERELSRLILRDGATGLPESSGALERIDAGAFQLAPDPQPQTVGMHVAQQVYRQLSATRTQRTAPPGSNGAGSNR